MATLEALSDRFRIDTRMVAGIALDPALKLALGRSALPQLGDIKSLFGRFSTISRAVARFPADVRAA